MQGDGLGAQQVVAGREVGGDQHVHHAAARVEVLGAPVVGRARGAVGRPRVLEDLEPGGVGARGRGGVGHGRHVDDHGAVVRAADGFGGTGAVAWLLVHLDCGTGVSGLFVSGWLVEESWKGSQKDLTTYQ